MMVVCECYVFRVSWGGITPAPAESSDKRDGNDDTDDENGDSAEQSLITSKHGFVLQMTYCLTRNHPRPADGYRVIL